MLNLGKSLLRCVNKEVFQQFRFLNLQEHQSKEILNKYGCAIQQYIMATSGKEAEKNLTFGGPGTEYVVKAQILAGGRGKGHFVGGRKGLGGVFVTRDREEAFKAVDDMVGKHLVTKQTPKEGVLVEKVMVAKGLDFDRETYLAILMDREHNGPVIVASPMGGMDIEAVAKTNPECIYKEPVDILKGITDEQQMRIAKLLRFEGKVAELAAIQIKRLYELFIAVDATQVEINPFVETKDGLAYCIDAKLNFDDSAEFRQKEIFSMDNESSTDPREVEAKKHHLNYISMEGNIACLVNGAGLAMATMDIIKLYGGLPANFLDIGGGANKDQVTAAVKIISSDPQVKSVLVNIFAGILDCQMIAEGLVEAVKQIKLNVPLIVRLEGTNVTKAIRYLEQSGLPMLIAEDLDRAAKLAVKSAQN